MSFPRILFLATILIGWSCEQTDLPEIIEKRIEDYEVDPSWADSMLITLPIEEKISQLILVKANYFDSLLVQKNYAGIVLNGKVENILNYSKLNRGLKLPMFIGTEHFDLAGLLPGVNQLANGYTLDQTTLDSLLFLESEVKSFLGVNFSTPSEIKDKKRYHPLIDFPSRKAYIQLKRHQDDYLNKIVHVSEPYFFPSNSPHIAKEESMANSALLTLIDSGLLNVPFSKPKAQKKPFIGHKKFSNERLNHRGLSIWSNSEITDSNELMNAFLRGADLIQVSIKDSNLINKFVNDLVQKVKEQVISVDDINARVRKILIAKTWMNKEPQVESDSEFYQAFQVALIGMKEQLIKQSIVLVSNNQYRIPFTEINRKACIINYGQPERISYSKWSNNYQKFEVRKVGRNKLKSNAFNRFENLVFTINEELDNRHLKDLSTLLKMDLTNELVVVNINHPKNLILLDSLSTVIQVFNQSTSTSNNLMEAIYGGVAITGCLPKTYGKFLAGHSIKSEKIRVEYSLPEEVGISSDSLSKIRRIVREMIFSGVAPGCQIMAVKSGKIIYNQSFGHLTYEKLEPVTNRDIYDLASLTKIIATTPAFMHFHDKGLFQITDSLGQYLPDSISRILGRPSAFENITFQELLLHQSGAPSGLRLKPYLEYQHDTIGRWDAFFCDKENEIYTVPVAENFFLDRNYLDTLWLLMNSVRLDSSKSYKYSDINMNMLYSIMKSKLNETTFSNFVDSVFYHPMGLGTLGYSPLQKNDSVITEIAPTEYDTYWRGSILKGFVHDPTAALFGGEAGNAGLFGSAADVGIFCQMLLNGGTYGGHQFIEESTVNLFTGRQNQSHRGLGFDKPTSESSSTRSSDCPVASYGHTGFTGICTWIDPENEFIFVFCSNRVYPDPSNNKINTMQIRARLHQVFYDQILR
ncbi:MAG: serine hydrolase [Flavobacteriales bacterium]|nr:serine hydrolase [Flavobacteriales bacterium]